MEYRIFNVHKDVNTCDCTQGCMDTIRVCTVIWHWEKNPLPHRGVDQRPQRAGPMLCQLSYIPNPLSDSVMRSDQLLRETSGADQRKHLPLNDFLGSLHWLPIATDRITRLSQKVDKGLCVLCHDSLSQAGHNPHSTLTLQRPHNSK